MRDDPYVEPLKVFREMVQDQQGTRVDFFMEKGPLASSHCLYLSTLITVELLTLGYDVEDFPNKEKAK